ncbi:MAG: TetR/AcrR family transcriptional regulator [Candidatus Latescibacterota bacterium]
MSAAVKQFADKGFGGARIGDIAAQAGVNKAALYYHIGDKEELYAMVIEQVLGGIADQMNDRIKMASTNPERIRAFIGLLAQNISDNPYIAPLLLREVASGGTNLPDKVMLQMVRIFGALFCVLEDAKAEGRFGPVNPLILHLMILGGVAAYSAGEEMRRRIGSLGEEELHDELDVSTEEAAAQMADLIVKGLGQ